jgi:hypothetical protein
MRRPPGGCSFVPDTVFELNDRNPAARHTKTPT